MHIKPQKTHNNIGNTDIRNNLAGNKTQIKACMQPEMICIGGMGQEGTAVVIAA